MVVARAHSIAIKITKNSIKKISIFLAQPTEDNFAALEGKCLIKAAAALFKVITVNRRIKISQ